MPLPWQALCVIPESSALNVCDVSKTCKSSVYETSSKLQHYRLGHIFRGSIECLTKEQILEPLNFSDANEHCLDCIKGNMLNI